MKQYIHGGDIYRMGEVTDFSVNINPLGMPKAAREAAVRGIEEAGRYPDWRHEKLIAAIASAKHLSPSSIIAGNGASELLYALTMSRMRKIRAWIPAPTFMEYEEAVLAGGGTVVSDLPFTEKNEKVMENCDMIFLCNPNNPTGTLYRREEILSLADECRRRGILLVVDESFLDFLWDEEEQTLLPEAEHNPALLVLRSMTKIYGMPGLRLGYAVSGREVLEEMRRVLQPWNLSIPAEYAGSAALTDSAFLDETRAYVERERRHLERQLKPYVKRLWPGTADFFLFEDDVDLRERLLAEKILIRSCEDIRGLRQGFYRIGVRTEGDNRKLIAAVQRIRQR